MIRTVAVLCVALMLALVVAACGGDEAGQPAGVAPSATPAVSPSPTDAAPAATEATTPAPSPTASPTTAGTAAPSDEPPPLPDSIRDLLEGVAEVRGLEAPPTIHALTVARENLEEVYVGLVSEEDRLSLDEETTLYRLLGYLDEDQHLWDITLSFLDSVLGFYSPDHKSLWVVTDEEGVGLEDLTPRQRDTLVHEILHALQDYHFDLDATFQRVKHNLDWSLAFTAVVEGDAVVHTGRYERRSLAIPAAGQLYFVAAANQLPDIPPAYIRQLYFPYTTGADWTAAVLANQGVEAIDGFLVDPPPATTLILHPELTDTGWEPEQIYASQTATDIRRHLGLGWHEKLQGSLGEFHLANYLIGDAPFFPGWLRAPANRTAVEAAEGWAGDRYFVFEHGDGEAVMVVFARFVSEEEAREFADVHRSVATRRADVVEDGAVTLVTRPGGNVVALLEPAGRDVIFAIGTSAEVARAALEPLVEG